MKSDRPLPEREPNLTTFGIRLEAGGKFWLSLVIIYLPREILLGLSESSIVTAKLYHKKAYNSPLAQTGRQGTAPTVIPYK